MLVQPQYLKLGKDVKSSGPLFESAILYGSLFVISTTVYYRERKKQTDAVNRFRLVQAATEERQPLLEK